MISAIKEDIYRYHGSNYNKLTIKLAYLYKPYTRYMYFLGKYNLQRIDFQNNFGAYCSKN